ncbi:MAG: DUF4397 domain-containing protein, partial [Niabella sp.]|nr:DUF4397 domain-containing protein [Niabella sp.]
KQLVVVNNITVPADTTCRVRFANFLYKVPGVSNVDVYSYKMGLSTPVFKNIAYAQVTDFMPYPTGSTDTIYVYPTGMTTPLIIKTAVIVNAVQRNYTAVLNNSYSSTNKKSNLLSFFATY